MDNIKGTLTRRMDSALNGLQKEFKALYTKEDFGRELKRLRAAGSQSNRPSILADLYDMFDACDISYERGKYNDYYEEIIKKSNIPDDYRGAEDKMILALYNQYEEYATSENYMQRIVNRLRNSDDQWESDSLRLQILKQFVKYGNSLQYYTLEKKDDRKSKVVTIYGGAAYIKKYLKEKLGNVKIKNVIDFIDNIEDDIFDVLESASKEQTKSKGPYAILKMVNDLANGYFRTGGETKKSLYLFAMVYGMTYYSGGGNGDILDIKSDIEVNLFRDYYVNNLMRFITQSYEKNLTNFEDPSGQGINYKNFAEMIYLYYISKNDCTPQDKIRLSDEMINRVKDSKVKDGSFSLSENKQKTSFYKGLVKRDFPDDLFSEDIICLPEKEFEDFIRNNYNCNTHVGSVVVSPMQLEMEQNTAFKEYSKILNDIQTLGMSLDECNYGLWITDVNAFKSKELKNICDMNSDIERGKFDKLVNLLLGIHYFMSHMFRDSSAKMSRTTLVVAYYYYYNALHEQDGVNKKQSFDKVFRDFKSGVDRKLETAGYQSLSSKNIFDVVIAFSSYAYMSM